MWAEAAEDRRGPPETPPRVPVGRGVEGPPGPCLSLSPASLPSAAQGGPGLPWAAFHTSRNSPPVWVHTRNVFTAETRRAWVGTKLYCRKEVTSDGSLGP